MIYEGHDAETSPDAEVVVVKLGGRQRQSRSHEARAPQIPVIQRGEMLAELMRLKYGIAIAGMHGKTTTTSMVAAVLRRAVSIRRLWWAGAWMRWARTRGSGTVAVSGGRGRRERSLISEAFADSRGGDQS